MSTQWATWKATFHFVNQEVRILVTDCDGDILKARLPGRAKHPRALVTFLEGIALWQGYPLCAVLHADDGSQGSFEQTFYGGEDLCPAESPLVYFEIRDRLKKGRRIRGVGDFRQLRMLGDRS